jgi:hypothetical protein
VNCRTIVVSALDSILRTVLIATFQSAKQNETFFFFIKAAIKSKRQSHKKAEGSSSGPFFSESLWEKQAG